MTMRRWARALFVLSCVACSAPPPTQRDGASRCRTDVECQDGVFCNGAERCEPDASGADEDGCLPAAREVCDLGERCDEGGRACLPACEETADADGDGARAIVCGGTDCDDTDALRFPGNVELCDPDGHDEDCDPDTYGIVDADGDGLPSALCCNEASDGTQRCGADCDDTRPGTRPTATEQCNGVDDDCDGMIDEGVMRLFHPDADGDGAGDPSAPPIEACAPPLGYVADDTDCDDGLAARRPGAAEVCDGIDNDCDGVLNGPGEDDDRDGYPNVLCAGLRGTDCDDADAAVHPGAAELCDLRDQDCGSGGGAEPSEDLDGDGHAAITAACEGGSLPKDDCDDRDPGAHPGLVERCDGVDEDCDGTIDEGADATCAAPFASASCRDGACVIDACDAGRASCDGRASTGCESDLTSDEGACGACDRACGLGGQCVEGACEELDLVLGASFACARRLSGAVACWGANGSGQLGLTGSSSAVAREASGVVDATALGASLYGVCAVRTGGGVRCWGSGRAAATPSVIDAIDVSGSGCALRDFGGLACWSLVAGDTPTATPRALPIDATRVAGWYGHTCAVRRTGAVRCFGANLSGQLGLGTLDASGEGEVVGLDDAIDVATGTGHTCAVRADGRVACWGSNDEGQLGDGTRAGRAVPVPVSGIADAIEITAGATHSCARRRDGGVACWGSNGHGELGDGTTTARATPVPVTGVADAVAIAAGDGFTCARVRDGSVLCWGANGAGQLGRGTFDSLPHPTPAPVGGLP